VGLTKIFARGLASRDFWQNPKDFAPASPAMHCKATKNFGEIFGFKSEVRKFLDGRILEVPLIILQYYKPSLFLFIKP
jgi:hypothetical protein